MMQFVVTPPQSHTFPMVFTKHFFDCSLLIDKDGLGIPDSKHHDLPATTPPCLDRDEVEGHVIFNLHLWVSLHQEVMRVLGNPLLLGQGSFEVCSRQASPETGLMRCLSDGEPLQRRHQSRCGPSPQLPSWRPGPWPAIGHQAPQSQGHSLPHPSESPSGMSDTARSSPGL